jgi:hypothetical protein
LEKYALTAASDSASVISLMSLSHEKGLENAWLARLTTEKRVNKRMVGSMGGDVGSSKLPLYLMIRTPSTGGMSRILLKDSFGFRDAIQPHSMHDDHHLLWAPFPVGPTGVSVRVQFHLFREISIHSRSL